MQKYLVLAFYTHSSSFLLYLNRIRLASIFFYFQISLFLRCRLLSLKLCLPENSVPFRTNLLGRLLLFIWNHGLEKSCQCFFLIDHFANLNFPNFRHFLIKIKDLMVKEVAQGNYLVAQIVLVCRSCSRIIRKKFCSNWRNLFSVLDLNS